MPDFLISIMRGFRLDRPIIFSATARTFVLIGGRFCLTGSTRSTKYYAEAYDLLGRRI